MDKLKSEQINLPLTRMGSEHDGGYVVLDVDYSNAFLISGGIADDNNFEIAMAMRGSHVHQIDFSIENPPKNHPNLTFSKQKLIGLSNTKNLGERSLDEVVAEVRSEFDKELLLKLDVEGSEWEILKFSDSLKDFRQIFLELHYLEKLAKSQESSDSIAILTKLLNQFFPVFISGNNCCGFVVLGGYSVPQVLEMTLLNRRFYAPSKNEQQNPNNIFQSKNYPDRAPLIFKSW